MKFRLWFLVFFIAMFYGCTYPVATRVESAVKFYSSYNYKVPGSVVLVMDEDIKNISRKAKASGCVCSAHAFPVRMADALAVSVRKTTERLFETVVEENDLPSTEQLAAANNQGTIYVKLNRLALSISFTSGSWSASAHASADLALDVTVRDAKNTNLMTEAISGSGHAEGEAGGSCSGMANVLSEAISQSVRVTLKRYAERLANSEIIRTSFAKPSEHRAAKTETKYQLFKAE